MKKLLLGFLSFFKKESLSYLKINTKSEYFPDKSYLIIGINREEKETAEKCLNAYKEKGIFSDYELEEVVEKDVCAVMRLHKEEVKREIPSVAEFFRDMNKVSNVHKLLLASTNL